VQGQGEDDKITVNERDKKKLGRTDQTREKGHAKISSDPKTKQAHGRESGVKMGAWVKKKRLKENRTKKGDGA